MRPLQIPNVASNIDNPIHRGRGPSRLPKERHALDRRHQPLPLPKEQCKPKLFFEVADQPADGGLRVQALSRDRDRARVKRRTKGLQALRFMGATSSYQNYMNLACSLTI